MSNKKIRELLAELHEEVQKTEVDTDTRSSLRELDSDIHDLLNSSAPESDTNFVLDRARKLEAKFAMSHPTVEGIMRKVIDILAKIGI